MSTSREVDNFRHKTMAGFAVVTEEEIFQMQNYAIPKNTKKAMKLEMKVLRSKQYFNIHFANMSSALTAFVSLLEEQLSFHGSISKSHPINLNIH